MTKKNAPRTKTQSKKKVKNIDKERESSIYIKVNNGYVLRIAGISQETGRPADPVVAEFIEPSLFPFNLQYKITRRLQAVREEAKFYEERRLEIVDKYAQKDEEGNVQKFQEGDRLNDIGELTDDETRPEIDKEFIGQPIPPVNGSEDERKFLADVRKLVAAEVEIALPPIKLSKWMGHKEMPKISDALMRLLIPLCEDEDD